MRLFKNRPNMTFDDAGGKPDQEFDMQPDHKGVLEYIPTIARFSNTEHLSIHFPTTVSYTHLTLPTILLV